MERYGNLIPVAALFSQQERLRITHRRSIRCARIAAGSRSQFSICGSAPKDHSPEFVSQPLHIVGVGGRPEPLSQVEERLFLPGL